MQRLGDNYSSIEKMAGQLLQKKTAAEPKDSTDSGLSFQEILSSTRESQLNGLL